MYIDSYETNSILKYCTDYYLKLRNIQNFKNYFDIYISNNILDDYNTIKHTNVLSDNDYSGLTIPPCNDSDKIIILISENNISPDFIFHELCHMEDMVLFAYKFCNNYLQKIQKHKSYQLFIYWTEFHATLITIPNSILFVEIINYTVEQSYIVLCDMIRNRLYNKFLNDIIDIPVTDIKMKNIMWYLAKIIVCNLYDNTNSYNISSIIIARYPFIIDLYNCMKTMLTFDGFVYNLYRLEELIDSIVL